jgi:hypothetical protein
MSLKRSHSSTRSSLGGSDGGAKVGRQEMYDELKKMMERNQAFTPVDIALNIGAGEPQVSRSLLGLAAEGCVEKLEAGKYRVVPAFGDLSMPEFIKVFNRASKTDSTRQRDLSEISRLKQNNDIMRNKLLAAIAERDHYLAALKQHGIDPGPPPAPPAAAVVVTEAVAQAAPPDDAGASNGAAAEDGGDDVEDGGEDEPPTGAAQT